MKRNWAGPFGQAHLASIDDRWRIRLAGEVSADLRPHLDAVLHHVATEQREVDVDLGEVTFLDSNGLYFLSRLATTSPTRVRVSGATGLTRTLLHVTGVHRVLTVDTA